MLAAESRVRLAAGGGEEVRWRCGQQGALKAQRPGGSQGGIEVCHGGQCRGLLLRRNEARLRGLDTWGAAIVVVAAAAIIVVDAAAGTASLAADAGGWRAFAHHLSVADDGGGIRLGWVVALDTLFQAALSRHPPCQCTQGLAHRLLSGPGLLHREARAEGGAGAGQRGRGQENGRFGEM